MRVGEALRFSVHALQANRVRTLLTALGLVIGNASVILVVTISLTRSRIVAMSFCEPRSCRLQLSS